MSDAFRKVVRVLRGRPGVAVRFVRFRVRRGDWEWRSPRFPIGVRVWVEDPLPRAARPPVTWSRVAVVAAVWGAYLCGAAVAGLAWRAGHPWAALACFAAGATPALVDGDWEWVPDDGE